MPKRRRDDDLALVTAHPKRGKTVVPTISEAKILFEHYDGATPIDKIADDEFLRGVYNSLRRKFNPVTSSSERDATTICNIDVKNLQMSETVTKQLPGWLEDPRSFWAYPFEREVFNTGLGLNTNVRNFVQSSWDLYDTLSTLKVLWRFNSVALCLIFMKWKPEWKLSCQLLPKVVTSFLGTFGCTTSPSDIEKTISIIRSGQRRLSFIIKLSGPSEEVLYTTLTALGLLFLDDIPDSSFDDERGLRENDMNKCSRVLLSKNIGSWLVETGAGRKAVSLLDLPLRDVWIDAESGGGRLLGNNVKTPALNSLLAAAEVALAGTMSDDETTQQPCNAAVDMQAMRHESQQTPSHLLSTGEHMVHGAAQTVDSIGNSVYVSPAAFDSGGEHGGLYNYWGWQVPGDNCVRIDEFHWQPATGYEWDSTLGNVS